MNSDVTKEEEEGGNEGGGEDGRVTYLVTLALARTNQVNLFSHN